MSKNYGEIFGERLKELRQEYGFTIEAFANEVGISKSSVGYYENQNRLPDIATAAKMAEVLNVTTDYLVGLSSARTQAPKLKNICDHVGLSDKAVNMLARLKKENPTRLSVINLLLEQAADDITEDYELDGEYEGSVLNAVCRYLCRYSSVDEFVADMTSSSDEGISSAIASALYQMILNQAIDAIKKLANSPKYLY